MLEGHLVQAPTQSRVNTELRPGLYPVSLANSSIIACSFHFRKESCLCLSSKRPISASWTFTSKLFLCFRSRTRIISQASVHLTKDLYNDTRIITHSMHKDLFLLKSLIHRHVFNVANLVNYRFIGSELRISPDDYQEITF